MTVRIQKEDFSLEDILQDISPQDHSVGAVCHFVGLVRGGNVAFLELEHHAQMSLQALEALENHLKNVYNIADCLLIHRYGKLKAGEKIVLVAVSSAHRESAFHATHYAMEAMKTDIPFWKCEHYINGEKKWLT